MVALMAIVMMFPFIFMFMVFLPAFRPWMRLHSNGIHLPIVRFLGMRLRGTPIKLLTDAYIELSHRGTNVTLDQVEKKLLANRSRIRNVRDLVDFVSEDVAKAEKSSTV